MNNLINEFPQSMREAYENARTLNKEEAEAIIEKLMGTRPESLFTKDGYPESVVFDTEDIQASPEWKKGADDKTRKGWKS